jgi:hypothetical protein
MAGAPDEKAGTEPRRVVYQGALLSTVLLLAHYLYRPLISLEHFGWDTYPLIVTSRVRSFADALSLWTEELMAGRYPLGQFYRPVTSLTFALDSALYGFDAEGFHFTNHLILLAGVGSAFYLARRLAAGSLIGAASGALVFALHPIHYATLPIAARRADMLSALLTMIVLASLPRPGTTRLPVASAALGFVLAYAAAASKETGIVLIPLIVLVLFVEASGGFRERATQTLKLGAAPLLGVLLFVVSRTIVLDGIGGHEGSGPVEAVLATPGVMKNLGNVMLSPRPPLYGDWALLGIGVYTVLVLWVVRREENRPGLVLVGWFVALSAVTALAGELRTWYGCPYLPFYAALCGLLAAGLVRTLTAFRFPAFAFCLPLTLFVIISPLRHSALIVTYGEWEELSVQEQGFLAAAAAAIEAAPLGTVVEGGRLPRALPSQLAGMRAVAVEDYSVQAWADLRFPERRVRVALGDAEAGPDEVVLLVTH